MTSHAKLKGRIQGIAWSMNERAFLCRCNIGDTVHMSGHPDLLARVTAVTFRGANYVQCEITYLSDAQIKSVWVDEWLLDIVK